MSDSQIESFFRTSRFAVFGTNSADGPPQLTTVWFLYEEGPVYVGIERRSVKYRNLTRDMRVALCVDGEYPDGRTVIMHGLAQILESGTAEYDQIVWRIIRRYHDTDEEALRYAESTSEMDSVLVKIRPQRIFGLDHGPE